MNPIFDSAQTRTEPNYTLSLYNEPNYTLS